MNTFEATAPAKVLATSTPLAAALFASALTASAQEQSGLDDIVVTAQKRELVVGPNSVELALWTRNLGNVKTPNYPVNFGFISATSFQQARTYGVDLSVRV